jgi:hypothetical protein
MIKHVTCETVKMFAFPKEEAMKIDAENLRAPGSVLGTAPRRSAMRWACQVTKTMAMMMTRMVAMVLGSSATMARTRARTTNRDEKESEMRMAWTIASIVAKVAVERPQEPTGLAWLETRLMRTTRRIGAAGLAKDSTPATVLAKLMQSTLSATRIAGRARVAKVVRVVSKMAVQKERDPVVLATTMKGTVPP